MPHPSKNKDALSLALQYLTSAQKENWSQEKEGLLLNHQKFLNELRSKPPQQVDLSLIPLRQAFETVLALNPENILSFSFPWQDMLDGKTPLGTRFAEEVLLLSGLYEYIHAHDVQEEFRSGWDVALHHQFRLCDDLAKSNILPPTKAIPHSLATKFPISSVLAVALAHASPAFIPLWNHAKRQQNFNHQEIAHALVLGATNWASWVSRLSSTSLKAPDFNELSADVLSYLDWSQIDMTKQVSPDTPDTLGAKLNERVFSIIKSAFFKNRHQPDNPIVVPEGLIACLHAFAKSPSSDNYNHHLSFTHRLCWSFMMQAYSPQKRESSIDRFLSQTRQMPELLQFPWENPLFNLSEKQSLLFTKLVPHAVALACFVSLDLKNELLPQNESTQRGISRLHPFKSIEEAQENLAKLVQKSLPCLQGEKPLALFNTVTETIKEDLAHLTNARKTSNSFSKEEERLWLKWTALSHFDATSAPVPPKKKM